MRRQRSLRSPEPAPELRLNQAKGKAILRAKARAKQPRGSLRQASLRSIRVIRPRQKVLLLTAGTKPGCNAPLLEVLGCTKHVLCTALFDTHGWPEFANCSGETAVILEGLIKHPSFSAVMQDAVQKLAAERNRAGGAVVGFLCNHGKHRSVGMAHLLARACEAHGWICEVRHMGDRRTMPCSCPGMWCKAVWGQLRGGHAQKWERAAMLWEDHWARRARVLEVAVPMIRSMFQEHGL